MSLFYGTFEDLKSQYANEPQKAQFIDILATYLQNIGNSSLLSTVPNINGKYLDLHELFSRVLFLGGIDTVNRENKWESICSKLGISIQHIPVVSTAYINLLSKYEYRYKSQNQTTINVPRPQARSNVPSSILQSHLPQQSHESMALPHKIEASIRDLDSSDPQVLVRALNFLCQKSFELNDSNALLLENHPIFVLHLGSLLDTINPQGRILFEEPPYKELVDRVLEKPSSEWDTQLPFEGNAIFVQASKYLDENSILLSVLTLIRNLSFEVSNENLLSSSTPIVRHLSSIIMSLWANPAPSLQLSEAIHLSLDILCNIANRIEVGGRKRIQQYAWLEDTLEATFNKPLFRIRLSPHLSEISTASYVASVTSLFPFCYAAITQQHSNRFLLLRAVELLGKLATVPENASMFHRCPHSLLESLIELLAVNLTSSDPLTYHEAYFEPSRPLPRPGSLPPAFLGSSFYPDLCDMEVRDVTLETLSSLASLSPRMQVRMGSLPFFIPILIKIIDIKTVVPFQQGGHLLRSRTEGMMRALDILKLLSTRVENKSYFHSSVSMLIHMASGDDSVADLLGILGSGGGGIGMGIYPSSSSNLFRIGGVGIGLGGEG